MISIVTTNGQAESLTYSLTDKVIPGEASTFENRKGGSSLHFAGQRLTKVNEMSAERGAGNFGNLKVASMCFTKN